MDTGKPGTILVVEDEKKISDIVVMYLEREGFSAVVADTGEKAMGLLKISPDLIILDLMLPDISGEDLCKAVRESSDVPIIMLTAKSGEEDRIRGLGIGADDYVVKPFSPRELVARVKAHTRRTRKLARKVLSFNNGLLVMDTETLEAKKKGEPLSLTHTEFKILVILAERPGRVLSRLQLINMVQGYDFEGYDRTVDAHVKNLRHKIEDDQRNPQFIKTVYGVGYKFTGVPDEE
ncbi:MAG TPA: response regulator transcription factor [Thermodesulfovibrionales bacterium]|jgi:DNA-binding response OmpR family regulator|nr:response regulator transcription factor [Thermodesulfovibrionales bacterium]